MRNSQEIADLSQKVRALEAKLRDVEARLPTDRGRRVGEVLTQQTPFKTVSEKLRTVPTGGAVDQHLESLGNGLYVWADTREIPAGGSADEHLEADGLGGYDWAVTREVPATSGVDGLFLVDNGDGTYAWRVGVQVIDIFSSIFTGDLSVTPAEAVPLTEELATIPGLLSLENGDQIHFNVDGFVIIQGQMMVTSNQPNSAIRVFSRANGVTDSPGITSPNLSADEQWPVNFYSGVTVVENDYIQLMTEEARNSSTVNLDSLFMTVAFLRLGALPEGAGGTRAGGRR